MTQLFISCDEALDLPGFWGGMRSVEVWGKVKTQVGSISLPLTTSSRPEHKTWTQTPARSHRTTPIDSEAFAPRFPLDQLPAEEREKAAERKRKEELRPRLKRDRLLPVAPSGFPLDWTWLNDTRNYITCDSCDKNVLARSGNIAKPRRQAAELERQRLEAEERRREEEECLRHITFLCMSLSKVEACWSMLKQGHAQNIHWTSLNISDLLCCAVSCHTWGARPTSFGKVEAGKTGTRNFIAATAVQNWHLEQLAALVS